MLVHHSLGRGKVGLDNELFVPLVVGEHVLHVVVQVTFKLVYDGERVCLFALR
jgi:hypothetical protein